jgi:hypothetical protein
MATIREQIARYTRAEATTQQQPEADDPLAPTPIRFTHWHDADGVIHQRTVNAPTTGWHLEDDAEASEAEPLRPQGQASTPSRQTRDSQQQARVTQAYPPDYEDADEQSTAQARIPRSTMRYQHTLPGQYRGQTVLPTPPQRLRRQRLTGNAPGQQQHPPTRRNRHWSVYLVDRHGNHDRPCHRLVQPGKLVATRAGRLDLWHASDVPDRCRGRT